jgi:hypothetical protein
VGNAHRWSRLLKQLLSITVYRLPIKENKLPFPFAVNKQKFVLSIFRLQQTNGSCRFSLAPFSVREISKTAGMDMET